MGISRHGEKAALAGWPAGGLPSPPAAEAEVTEACDTPCWQGQEEPLRLALLPRTIQTPERSSPKDNTEIGLGRHLYTGPGGSPSNTPGPPSFANNSFYRSQPSGQAFAQNNPYTTFGDDSSNREVMDPWDVDLTEGGIPHLPSHRGLYFRDNVEVFGPGIGYWA
ncbi:hypothetical protein V502_05124 [Pseudogymnoascus sp. VKM F-4520 (FW-2644)]|nr:hypothetical protein V502_05124 [Pseudogymnoascus sp. VKM F-4520 (FW-2644)]